MSVEIYDETPSIRLVGQAASRIHRRRRQRVTLSLGGGSTQATVLLGVATAGAAAADLAAAFLPFLPNFAVIPVAAEVGAGVGGNGAAEIGDVTFAAGSGGGGIAPGSSPTG